MTAVVDDVRTKPSEARPSETKTSQKQNPIPQRDRQKVLFLAQLPPPLHGASVTSRRVHDYMIERGDLDLSCLWLGGATKLQDVGKKSLSKMLGFLWFLVRLAWQVVTGKRYEMAYLTFAPASHTLLRDGLLIFMAKRLARRTLVHLHTEALEFVFEGNTRARRIARRMIRGVELITITEKVAEMSRAQGTFAAVHLLPNCVEDNGPPPLLPGKSLRCGYLANLDPRKGVLRFVEAIDACRQAGLPVTARVVGQSTALLTTDQLQAEINRRGLNGVVEVVGPLFGADKNRFYTETDIFIYLSLRDYFPLVLIEAMSSGAIPIVYDNEGEAELVGDNFADNVVQPGLDTEAMARYIASIVARYHENPELLARHRTAARARFLERYTEVKFREQLYAILGRG